MAVQNKAMHDDALEAIRNKIIVLVFDENEGTWSKATQVQRTSVATSMAKKHGVTIFRAQTQIGNAISFMRSQQNKNVY